VRSIGLRLVLSFAAVILVGVGGVAVLAGRETASEFRNYVERGRISFVEQMATSVAQYYRRRGDWSGVDLVLQPWLRGPIARRAVADAAGTLVADTATDDEGQPAASAGLGQGTPLLVDGQPVGTLYVTVHGGPFGRGPQALAVDAGEARAPGPRGPERRAGNDASST
jgi:two-component system OmpR family sensor kinase/two-component system sensor histidine kinase BaeS